MTRRKCTTAGRNSLHIMFPLAPVALGVVSGPARRSLIISLNTALLNFNPLTAASVISVSVLNIDRSYSVKILSLEGLVRRWYAARYILCQMSLMKVPWEESHSENRTNSVGSSNQQVSAHPTKFLVWIDQSAYLNSSTIPKYCFQLVSEIYLIQIRTENLLIQHIILLFSLSLFILPLLKFLCNNTPKYHYQFRQRFTSININPTSANSNNAVTIGRVCSIV